MYRLNVPLQGENGGKKIYKKYFFLGIPVYKISSEDKVPIWLQIVVALIL